jgi:XTP/dITP diphosphohydrolase
MHLILATTNPHKAEEFAWLFQNHFPSSPWQITTLLDHPELPEPPETGETFEDNALQKARFIFQHTGLPTLADDSGLEVDALGGAPGVRSRRFSPEETAEANNRLLLARLDGVADRRARFVCALALVTEHGEATVRGVSEGHIATTHRGGAGFGYDPLFHADDLGGTTFAEADSASKNAVSHRGRAMARLPDLFQAAGLAVNAR